MDIWDEYLFEQKTPMGLKTFLDSHGMILFFKKDKDYYGAGEDSRVIFARLKTPDEDTTDGWEDEASFLANNLTKMIHGEPCQHLFNKNDINKIKIVDQEKVVQELTKLKDKKEPETPVGIQINVAKGCKDRDEAPNMQRTDEE
jgi:hypothetical protein